MFTDALLWYVSTFFLLFLLIFLRSTHFKKKSIKKIDRMTGEEFELYLKKYFEEEGYRVSLTKRTGDFGADLLLKKAGQKIVVQVKRYSGNVGLSAIQEANAAIKYYGANKAMVITNSYYTKGAKELAKVNHISLWDRKILLKKAAKP